MKVVYVLILSGCLSYGPVLPKVVEYRLTRDVSRALVERPPEGMCLLATRWPYDYLVGQVVIFRSDDGGEFPMYVVDYEDPGDAPYMKKNYLLGDTNCNKLVHQSGSIYFKNRPY